MTNKDRKFTPAFNSEKSKEDHKFTPLGSKLAVEENFETKQENDDSESFIDELLVTTIDPNDISTLVQDPTEHRFPTSGLGDYKIDDFDALVSEIDMMSSVSAQSSGHERHNPFEDDQNEVISGEITEEEKHEIFTDGYMQGTMEQKEIMDNKLSELQKTVELLKINSLTPVALSDDINDAIYSFVDQIAKSLLSEAKKSLFTDIVESKIADFIAEVKGWELSTTVYCSSTEYTNLSEIFTSSDKISDQVMEGQIGFRVNDIQYLLDSDLAEGKFRIELGNLEGQKLEAVMDVNDHFDKIMNSLANTH